MAIIFYDVGTGKPHATIQAAIDAIPGNLLGLGEQRVRIYAGGVHVGNMYRYDEGIDMNAGFTNESTSDFVSVYGMVPCLGRRNTGIVLQLPAGGSPITVLRLGKFSRIRNLGLTCAAVAPTSIYGIQSGGGLADSYIENCVIFDLQGAGGRGIDLTHTGTHYVRNTVIMNCVTAVGIYAWRGTKHIQNCTLQNLTIAVGNTYGIYVHNTTAHITNCIAVGIKNACLAKGAGANPTVTYTISSDATADDWGGAGNQINKDPAADIRFTDTGVGTEDIHIQEGSCAQNAGTDLSGEGFDDDIDGGIRPHGPSWDIGADEYGVPIPILDGITPDLQWTDENAMFYATNPMLQELSTATMPDTAALPGKYRKRDNVAIDTTVGWKRPPGEVVRRMKDGHIYTYRLDTEDAGKVTVVGSFLPEFERKSTRVFRDGGKRRLDR